MNRVLLSVKGPLLLLLAVMGFAVVVWILVSRLNARTPVYQGKPLQTWLLQLSASDPKAQEQAQAAFKALGTNVVPELARLVRTDDARWRTLIYSHATNFSRPLWRLLRARVRPPMAHAIQPAAAQALGKLGPAAAPAVPALIHMLLKGKNPYEQGVAAQSLAQIGPPAVGPLVEVAVYGEGFASDAAAGTLVRYYPWFRPGGPAGKAPPGDPTAAALQKAIETLGARGRTNQVVTQLLARAARDPAPDVRLAALKALVQRNRNLQPVLRELVSCSYETSPAIREWSARGLGKIAPPSKLAAEELSRLAEDKEESVRAAAQAALRTLPASGSSDGPAPPR